MAELARIGKHWSSVGLLLAFPKKTTMIPHNHADALEMIAFGIQSGGKALAWYGTDSNGSLGFKVRPEYAGEKWALDALKRIVARMQKERAEGPPKGSS